MNLSNLRKIGQYGMLVFVMSSGIIGVQGMAVSTKEDKVVTQTAGKAVIELLRAFKAENDDPRTLVEFFDAIIAILEDPVKAAEFKKEYPSIDIKKLIDALKKVRNKTNAMLIGLALKPFFKYLPEDLQDISKLWSAINRRTAKKK